MRISTRLRRLTLVLVVALIAGSTLTAQRGERFRGRLSTLPVDRLTAPTITGWGEATGVLDGDELTITATFEGMSSPATAAHVHRARKGVRGPVAFAVDVPPVSDGKLEETVTLTVTQRRDLRDGLYYLQIHTEGNTAGELRGWLLPTDR